MFQPNRFRQEAISSCSHLVFSIPLLVNFWFNSLWIFSDIRCFANIGCLPRFRQRNDERHRMFLKHPMSYYIFTLFLISSSSVDEAFALMDGLFVLGHAYLVLRQFLVLREVCVGTSLLFWAASSNPQA